MNNKEHVLSPIFDNGACLFPRNHEFKIDEDWIYDRIYTFPNSKIMFCPKPMRERSSYIQVIGDGRIPSSILE